MLNRRRAHVILPEMRREISVLDPHGRLWLPARNCFMMDKRYLPLLDHRLVPLGELHPRFVEVIPRLILKSQPLWKMDL